MNYTEQLKDEHKGITLMLQILGSICNILESGGKVEATHLESILEFLSIFADKCHHAKEEELLFPAMENAGISREGGPIGVMLQEHVLGRQYIKGLGEGVAEYKAGMAGASEKIVQNARNYIALLSQHITKEDTVLYPMADAYIPGNIQEELLKQFDMIERERIGAGKHEEFHELLKQLKSRYLT